MRQIILLQFMHFLFRISRNKKKNCRNKNEANFRVWERERSMVDMGRRGKWTDDGSVASRDVSIDLVELVFTEPTHTPRRQTSSSGSSNRTWSKERGLLLGERERDTMCIKCKRINST